MNFFVASTKNIAAATKRFVDRTKHFVVTKYFCYPYFNKFFFGITKPFFRVGLYVFRQFLRDLFSHLMEISRRNLLPYC